MGHGVAPNLLNSDFVDATFGDQLRGLYRARELVGYTLNPSSLMSESLTIVDYPGENTKKAAARKRHSGKHYNDGANS